MSEHAIVTENLGKTFGNHVAVNGLNLHVPTGAVYGFLGRNGAGKSTTMRMLLGLQHVTQGKARVLGLNPLVEAELLEILQRVSFVPQRKQLYGWATPAEMVRMNRGFFPRWSDATAANLARRLEIPMDMKIKKLSVGNQTKVSLLLALSQDAEVVILDEPTVGLDPVMVDELLRTLIDEHVGRGRTIFLSSHQMAELEQICDWIGILEQGQLLLEARLEEIRNNFRMITASGENLLIAGLTDVVSYAREARTAQYVVAKDAEAFAARLQSQGAVILEVSPIGLRELFLHLVRKENSSCTPGNAGAKPEPVSLSC